MTKILIVEDEEVAGRGLEKRFVEYGAEVARVKDGDAAITHLGTSPCDGVVLDLRLKDSRTQGLGVLDWIKRERPHMAIVVVTADVNLSIRAGGWR